MPTLDYSKWEKFANDECDEKEVVADPAQNASGGREYANYQAYAQEVNQAGFPEVVSAEMEAYEAQRPRDRVMHHFTIKDAGDPAAIGEYYPDKTGEMRNGLPVYRNSNGIIITRETLQMQDGDEAGGKAPGWIIGHQGSMQGMYAARGQDQSPPSIGWRPLLAPAPVPRLCYFTHAMAADSLKERGNRAVQKQQWEQAEELYSQGLECKMEARDDLLAALLSNRSEVRLRTLNFEGAAADARLAMKHLRAVPSSMEAKETLRKKSGVRLAKALLSMGEVTSAREVLQELHMQYPQLPEVLALMQEAAVMAKADPAARVRADAKAPARRGSDGSTDKVLSFVRAVAASFCADATRLDSAAASGCAGALGSGIKKLEYLLIKARSVEGPCFGDVQIVLRTSGCLAALLRLARAQWKEHLEGKCGDAAKLPGLIDAASAISLACESSAESTKLAAGMAHVFVALLGSCNRKVDATVCARLIALVAAMWKECRQKATELLHAQPACVERASSFLAQAILIQHDDDVGAPDSPLLPLRVRSDAVGLLGDLATASGRIEKQVLKGAVPHLADPGGEGFFTSELASVRALGELVAQRAISDPSTVTCREVQNLVAMVQLLIGAGPVCDAKEADIASLTFEASAMEMKFVDLDAWSETFQGKQAALALRVVAKAMEYRLVLKDDRALEREDFEDSFIQGNGLFVAIPLIQGPPRLAEPALLCLASLAQARERNVDHLVALSALNPLLGLPSPVTKPMASHVRATLKASAAARRHAAKVLAKCITTQVGLDLLANAGEGCVKELIHLATATRADGRESLEAFHDMLHVFTFIAGVSPGCLCRSMPSELLNVLADMADPNSADLPRHYAGVILETLQKDPASAQHILPILRRVEGQASDIGDELRGYVRGGDSAVYDQLD